MKIVGVDCATVDQKVGLALAHYEDGTVVVQEIAVGAQDESVVAIISDWLDNDHPTLLALDAPLGWPAPMGETLSHHHAGQPIAVTPDLLFRRITDRVVREQIGRRPLDVGADRIARTAHSALRMLEALRQRTGAEIRLSWRPEHIQGVAAIEVYPAATLSVYSIRATGYKKKQQRDARRSIIEQVGNHLRLPQERDLLLSNADALDAVICVLAGVDYLRGSTIQPPDDDRIRKEGWIWVRARKGRGL